MTANFHEWLREQGLAFDLHRHGAVVDGTPGYGGCGPTPGYYGFGLSFHRGYGYGRDSLGVGSDGGNPYYGGTGYPRGGQVYPGPMQPGGGDFSGPLPDLRPIRNPTSLHSRQRLRRPDHPAVDPRMDPFRGSQGLDTTPAAGSGPPSAGNAPSLGEMANSTARGRSIGIDEEPVVDADGRKGIKVINVLPGTAAEQGGLHAGDVIYSINGYLTTQRGNLAWIIANAASDNVLHMNVPHEERWQGAYPQGPAPG